MTQDNEKGVKGDISPSLEDLREELREKFQEYVKTEEYKEQFSWIKNENSHLKDYLIHLSIFYWYREEWINSLEPCDKEKMLEVTSGKIDKVEEKRDYVVKAVRSYTPEEHLKEFGELKEITYENLDEDQKPFVFEGVEEIKQE
ncbi:MAG: hypothetical protein RLY43_2191 [Bacteroidota bacterium]|jgi:hypothetical protein